MKTAEVKKAEAVASELRHVIPARLSSFANRASTSEQTRGVEGGDLARQRGKKRKSLATGRI